MRFKFLGAVLCAMAICSMFLNDLNAGCGKGRASRRAERLAARQGGSDSGQSASSCASCSGASVGYGYTFNSSGACPAGCAAAGCANCPSAGACATCPKNAAGVPCAECATVAEYYWRSIPSSDQLALMFGSAQVGVIAPDGVYTPFDGKVMGKACKPPMKPPGGYALPSRASVNDDIPVPIG